MEEIELKEKIKEAAREAIKALEEKLKKEVYEEEKFGISYDTLNEKYYMQEAKKRMEKIDETIRTLKEISEGKPPDIDAKIMKTIIATVLKKCSES